MLKNAVFETSVFRTDKILETDKKQIVLVGKSNVGKSSFINSLANQKRLARVGNTPGKTRSINYYNINDEFYLVDLPGYGYSEMSLTEKSKVNKLIDYYIDKTHNISHIFLILDIRHTPTSDDKTMYKYLKSKNIGFTIIANKADKIAKTKIDMYVDKIQSLLDYDGMIIPFSSENKLNVELVENRILDLAEANHDKEDEKSK